MSVSAVFPTVSERAGMYESFYLRAVAPEEPAGVWIRYTVHKRPGARPRGSLWCTVWDGASDRPFQHKLTSEELDAPSGGWISIGDARLSPSEAHGTCGQASWSLRFASPEAELRHLPRAWMYRAPWPRTKLTSPAPLARFDGVLELPGREPIELAGWPGMVGHNWGAEHAARWIWLHGCGFAGAPGAWLDLALGRLLVGSRLTPWVANGALCLDGERHRLGGVIARRPRVRESPDGAELELAGARGLRVRVDVGVPAGTAAGWRYADPGAGAPQGGTSNGGQAGQHDVVNCSIARLEIAVSGRGSGARQIGSDHGGAYELGMKERDHDVPIAPFADG